MPTRPTRLLCVGNDSDLLRTRCAVLSQSGYDATSATVTEAELLLLTEEFDLIVVSAFLNEWEKGRILSAAGRLPTLVLRGLTHSSELLAEVERMLAEPSLEALTRSEQNETARKFTFV
jgi:CheY-like chemotaxis protein